MDARISAWFQAWALTLWDSPRDQRGQGTVEYVGTVVMVALLVAAIAGAAGTWGGDLGDDMKKVLEKALRKVNAL